MIASVPGPCVYVIVLSRNERAHVAECLRSLSALNYPVRTVVVDNDSTDGGPEAVRRDFPAVDVIANGANLGYAEGNNVGLRFAIEHGADYVFILNSDTIVASDAVTELVQSMERDPQAAFAGPLVYHFDEPGVIQSAGGERTRDWRFVHRSQNVTDQGQYRAVEQVAWVTGCAVLARVAALKTFGLIDAAFFLYNEEVDWCVRARDAGYHVLFVPAAKIWHKGVRRHYEPSPRVTYFSARNELLLLTKHRAGAVAVTKAVARHVRTLASWSLRPRWRSRRAHRNALAFALRDFVQRRYGPPPVALQ